jgi:hypothetical protein
MNCAIRSLTAILCFSALALSGATAFAGVTGPAFYVDGELYRTVGTPADLPAGPPQSHDVIYQLGAFQQYNVATAEPGDRDYNGGRWEVHAVAFDDYAQALADFDFDGSGDFDSGEELYAAFDDGAAYDLGIVRRFECPVIPLSHRR